MLPEPDAPLWPCDGIAVPSWSAGDSLRLPAPDSAAGAGASTGMPGMRMPSLRVAVAAFSGGCPTGVLTRLKGLLPAAMALSAAPW